MLANNKLDADTSSVGSGSARHSLRQVESIVEDEEEGNAFSKLPPASRHRQGSITSPPDQPSLAANRNRSFSMSSSGSRAFGKKVLRNAPPVSSSHMFHSSSLSSVHVPNQAPLRQPPGGVDTLTFPSKTRKIQRNRESMDLDDIMNGLDDDTPSSAKPAKPPVAAPTVRSEPGKKGVSQSTRDLIDFLSEGPPETPSLGSSYAPSFDGHSSSPKITTMDSGRKAPGRLQRMISKLSIGGSDRPRASDEGRDGLRTPTRPTPPLPPVPSLLSKPSIASLSPSISPLANRPIPPRYPRPPSPPPSSPSQSSAEEPVATRAKKPSGQDSLDTRSIDTHPLQTRQNQNRVASPVAEKRDENTSNHEINGRIPKPADQEGKSNNVNHQSHKSPISPDRTYPITPAPSSRVSPANDPVSLPPQTVTRSVSSRKPLPSVISPVPQQTETVQPATRVTPSGLLTDNDAHEIHRLMSHAGSADECRLILDMFLARAGTRIGGTTAVTVALPPTSSTLSDSSLESTVVELLLGGETPQELPCSPRRLRFKRHKKGLELRPHTTDGSLSVTPSESSAPSSPFRSPPTPAS